MTTLEDRARAAGINEFTGASEATLRRRLHSLRRTVDDICNDPDAGGGGSPLEGLSERIDDIETELKRRHDLQKQTEST